jgi:hypothetical protein
MHVHVAHIALVVHADSCWFLLIYRRKTGRYQAVHIPTSVSYCECAMDKCAFLKHTGL